MVRIRSCGFHRIFTYTDQRLFQDRLGNGPAGLEPTHRGYKQEKSYCQNTKKYATSYSTHDPKLPIYYFIIFFIIHSKLNTKRNVSNCPYVLIYLTISLSIVSYIISRYSSMWQGWKDRIYPGWNKFCFYLPSSSQPSPHKIQVN